MVSTAVARAKYRLQGFLTAGTDVVLTAGFAGLDVKQALHALVPTLHRVVSAPHVILAASDEDVYCRDEPMGVVAGLSRPVRVLAFTRDALVSLLKLLTAASYCYHTEKKLPAEVFAKIGEWRDAAISVLAEIKIGAGALNALVTAINAHQRKATEDTALNISVNMDNIAEPIVDDKRAKFNQLRQDTTMTSDLLSYFTLILGFIKTADHDKWETLTKQVKDLKDPSLNALLLPKAVAVKIDTTPFTNLHNHLAKLTKRKSAQRLSREEKTGLTDAQKAKVAALEKPAKEMYRNALQQVVRNSGRPHLPLNQVRQTLGNMGVPTWPLPIVQGHIDLHIGEDSKLYTPAGKELKFGQVGGTIRINPEYDPATDKVGVGRGLALDSNSEQNHSTVDYQKGKGKKTEKLSEDLMDNLDEYRKRWGADLAGKDENKRRWAALIEFIHQTYGRIGNDKSAEGIDKDPTYGIGQLLKRHVKIVKGVKGNTIVLTYLGKSGMNHIEKVRPVDLIAQRAIQIFESLLANKKPSDRIWTNPQGRPINKTTFASYFKKITGNADMTLHKFRHAAGTKMFNNLLAKHPLTKKNPTQAEVNAHHKMIVTKVGEALGHRRVAGANAKDDEGNPVPEGTEMPHGNMARSSYISPKVQAEYYRKHGYNPLPKWLETAVKYKED